MKKELGLATVILAILGTLWAGYMRFDATYARAAAVEKRFDKLDRTLMQGQRQQLRREEVEYSQKALKQGGLNVIERKRLQEVQDEIQAIDRELNPKEKP